MTTRIVLLLVFFTAAAAGAAPRRPARKPAHSAGKGVHAGKASPAPTPPAAEQRPADAPAPARPAQSDEDHGLRRGDRVEFDGRLIEGQTAASGAIYLFERLPSELRSMVRERQSYRREVLETLYPNGAPPAADTRAARPGAR